MTQEQQQVVQSPQGQPPVDDLGVKIYQDIQKHRVRLGRITDPSAKKVMMELVDTVMEFIESGFGYFLQFRNQTIAVIEGKDGVLEALADIDGRLNALEDEATAAPLDDEDADVIMRVRVGGEALARIALSDPNITTEGKTKLDEYLLDCAKIDEILAAATGEDEDEDDDAEGEDGADSAINASGANGAS